MILVTFLFVILNVLLWEWLSSNLSVRFFVDIVFAAVTAFFLPSILLLDSDLDDVYAGLGIVASLALTIAFVALYTGHLDTQMLLLKCMAYNIVLFFVFVLIHIKAKHPIIIEYEEVVEESRIREQVTQGMFERLALADGMVMLEGDNIDAQAAKKQPRPTTIDGFELKTIDNFSFETVDLIEEDKE